MRTLNKILITVPAKTARGGITNYYQVLKDQFSSKVEYFERGARTWPVRKGFFSEIARAWKDYNTFKIRIKRGDIALVQTSTSLGINTTVRDGFFLKHARKNGMKTIVFFRGWDDSAEKAVERKYLSLLRYFFFDSDGIIVLNKKSKDTLLRWGYKGPVLLESTLVDNKLLKGITPEWIRKKQEETAKKDKIRLLFLSRVEKRKGVLELLTAFCELKREGYTNLSLTICGDGFELENIKNIVKNEDIPDVAITGFVLDENKIKAYRDANVFIFPSHGEGMPNAVLESMGFGLPVITTKVGGIADFFTEHKNGLFIQIGSIEDIKVKIRHLLENKDMMLAISLANYEFAKKFFVSDIVARRMESIFEKIISNQNINGTTYTTAEIG
jgi:glycosyltransferase involved in cell wall biosynthesis